MYEYKYKDNHDNVLVNTHQLNTTTRKYNVFPTQFTEFENSALVVFGRERRLLSSRYTTHINA